MRTIKEMKARKNDARLKAMKIIENAEKEERDLTEEEDKQLAKLEDEMRSWEKQIIRLEVFKEDEPEPEKKEDANTKNDSAGEADETEVVKDNPEKDGYVGYQIDYPTEPQSIVVK